MGDRALGTMPAWGQDPWPSAFVIPKAQPDTQALQRMLWTLQHGQVEVRESTAPMTVDGKTYPAGSYVVLTKQPFGGYAKALLERQQYPNLFEYPGGPPKRPYDVTAHTLPLLFGVDVATVMGAEPALTEREEREEGQLRNGERFRTTTRSTRVPGGEGEPGGGGAPRGAGGSVLAFNNRRRRWRRTSAACDECAPGRGPHPQRRWEEEAGGGGGGGGGGGAASADFYCPGRFSRWWPIRRARSDGR